MNKNPDLPSWRARQNRRSPDAPSNLPKINSDFTSAAKDSSQEIKEPIFVASEQGLDTSVYKRVFKPQRLKSQI